jgi:tight adherence protein B
VTGLVYGLLAGLGVHLLWSRPPPRRTTARRHPAISRSQVTLLLAAAGLGLALGQVAIGGPAALAGAGLSALCATAGRRSLAAARRDQARRHWPALLEELRVLTTSGGRSLPRALLGAGASTPEPLRSAFVAAERTWRISGDFGLTLDGLKERLDEASTDLVCETLLVAHELGGADVGRRLRRLAEDRRRDLATRDLALAKLAGARFARRFVVIVPVGMAVAGQSVGTGRSAFASPGGQAVGLVAAGLVALCWVWSGRYLHLPEEPRVFA